MRSGISQIKPKKPKAAFKKNDKLSVLFSSFLLKPSFFVDSIFVVRRKAQLNFYIVFSSALLQVLCEKQTSFMIRSIKDYILFTLFLKKWANATKELQLKRSKSPIVKQLNTNVMKNFVKTYLIITIGLISQLTFAQKAEFIPTMLRENNFAIREIANKVTPFGWIYFQEDTDILPGNLLTEQKTLLGLNDEDELILSKTSNDKYGYEHRKYQQYYKGLLVKGGEITEHIKGGKVEFMNGKVVENLQFESNPTISESKALSICLEKIGAKKYTWEDIRWEESVKEETKNNEASNFPKGKLEFCLVTGSELISKNYDMVWTFQIHTLEPASIKNAIISATNGDIISIKEEGNIMVLLSHFLMQHNK